MPENYTPEAREISEIEEVDLVAENTTPKRDFNEALSLFRRWKETSETDYLDVVADINRVVGDFDGKDSQEIRESYPGWERSDFVKLLGSLFPSVEPVKIVEMTQEEREEIAKHLFQLKQALQRSITALGSYTMVRGMASKTLEESISDNNKKLHDIDTELQNMNFWQRRFSNAGKVLREERTYYLQRVGELKSVISRVPEEKRLADQKKQDDEELQRIQTTKDEIERIKEEIRTYEAKIK